MEIQELKGFLAVARCKSFSQAAKKTFRSQPAISLQVKSLEEKLSVKLFERIGIRNIILTNEGKILRDLASPLIDDIETLPTKFNELRGHLQDGVIKIATHTSVMVHLLPSVITQFKKKFPNCELSIVNRDRPDILSMINDGEVDFGITSLKNLPANINYKVFARYERMLIATKTHPLSKKTHISLGDIASFPLLLPPRGSNTRSIIDREFNRKGLKYKIAIELTGKEAIKAYTRMNLGVAIINGFYLEKKDKKELFYKGMGKYFGEAERGIITKKNKYLSYHAKELIKMIKLSYYNIMS